MSKGITNFLFYIMVGIFILLGFYLYNLVNRDYFLIIMIILFSLAGISYYYKLLTEELRKNVIIGYGLIILGLIIWGLGELFAKSISIFIITLILISIGIMSTYHSIFKYIKDQLKTVSRLEYFSYHDQLTGLYNRRYFKRIIEEIEETNSLPVSIIMVDIDNLKGINDQYGHARGDEIIKNAARVLDSVSRKSDTVVRMGGDEFVIILKETDKIDAKYFCDRIQRKCAEVNEEYDYNIPLNISVGSATKSDQGQDIEELLDNADMSMYKAKMQ
ncbi:MAG: diguanylate cyclase [Firmicutes bacterium]|nr:diguanylate cyclase [Bacillota bacterium]